MQDLHMRMKFLSFLDENNGSFLLIFLHNPDSKLVLLFLNKFVSLWFMGSGTVALLSIHIHGQK